MLECLILLLVINLMKFTKMCNLYLIKSLDKNKLGLNMSIGILNNVKCYQSIHSLFITEQCVLDVYF
jgi:hypothetical protein